VHGEVADEGHRSQQAQDGQQPEPPEAPLPLFLHGLGRGADFLGRLAALLGLRRRGRIGHVPIRALEHFPVLRNRGRLIRLLLLRRIGRGIGFLLRRIGCGIGLLLGRIRPGIGLLLRRIRPGIGLLLRRIRPGIGLLLRRIGPGIGLLLRRVGSGPLGRGPASHRYGRLQIGRAAGLAVFVGVAVFTSAGAIPHKKALFPLIY
jgi:hypothetical protein